MTYNVCLEFVVGQSGEDTLWALQGLGEWLSFWVTLVFGGQVLHQVELLTVHHRAESTLREREWGQGRGHLRSQFSKYFIFSVLRQ